MLPGKGHRGGVGQSKNWSRGDWVWVILIVEPIWKWYAWCVFCAGAHGVWYSWYSTALCPFKKMVSSQFWFWDLWGTHRQQAQRNPKNTCKLSVGSHRQPHQGECIAQSKDWTLSQPLATKKIQHSVPNVICCQLALTLSNLEFGPVRNQPSTGPNPTVTVRLTKKKHSPVKKTGFFPNILPQKKYQHSVPKVIVASFNSFHFWVWTCEEPTVNRPKPHRHRQPHQGECIAQSKDWTLSQHLATKKSSILFQTWFVASCNCFHFWVWTCEEPTVNRPKQIQKNIMPNVSVSTRLEKDQSTMANLAGNIQHRYARTYYLNLSYIRFIKSIKIS